MFVTVGSVNITVLMLLLFFSLSKVLVRYYCFQLAGVLSGCSYRESWLLYWLI